MKKTLLILSRIVIGLLALVTIAGVATAVVASFAEKDLEKAKSVQYVTKSMNSVRNNPLEGAYWELVDIVRMRDGQEVDRYTLITDIMSNLGNCGASYYYSFKDNAVLGFMPIDDPSYAIDLWQKNARDEWAILRDIVPLLKDAYIEGYDGVKWSESFAELCDALGIPFPSIAVTQYDWFEYDGIGTRIGLASVCLDSISEKEMILTYGNTYKLNYRRIQALPQQIAPITLYFMQKNYCFENMDRLGNDWKLSDEEIDEHFRKTFKSKKY